MNFLCGIDDGKIRTHITYRIVHACPGSDVLGNSSKKMYGGNMDILEAHLYHRWLAEAFEVADAEQKRMVIQWHSESLVEIK